MTKKFLYHFIFLLTTISIHSQYVVSLSTNIGGALPVRSQPGTSSKLFPGVGLNVSKNFENSSSLYVYTAISIDFYAYNYFSTSSRKDTVVATEILGNQTLVPTFYYTFIEGKTRVLSISPKLGIGYKILSRINIFISSYGKINSIHYDKILVRVQIGEGGLIPDINQNIDNSTNVNLFSFGLNFGMGYVLNDKLSLNIEVTRDITRFYKYNSIKDINGNDLAFYFTGAKLYLNYNF